MSRERLLKCSVSNEEISINDAKICESCNLPYHGGKYGNTIPFKHGFVEICDNCVANGSFVQTDDKQ